MKFMLIGIFLVAFSEGSYSKNFPAFWQRSCSEKFMQKTKWHWRAPQFIRVMKENGTWRNRAFRPFLRGYCCTTDVWQTLVKGNRAITVLAICQVPYTIRRNRAIPLKQTYYDVPPGIKARMRGRCKRITGCKNNPYVRKKLSLASASVRKLSQTRQGLMELFGCMKYIPDPLWYTC